MNAAVLPPDSSSRDPFKPPRGRRNGPALALALLAHALLIAALAFGVHWHNDEPTTIAAELWSATPQAAAPRAVEPPPPPPTAAVKPPPPTPKPEVAPPPTPVAPDPQIAIEKAKKDQLRKQQQQQQADEEARQEKAEQLAAQKADKAQRDKDAAQKKAAADQAAAKDKAAADKAVAAQEAAARQAYLKRIQGMAGATGSETDTGTAQRSSAPSANYAGRVAAYIKQKITLLDQVDGDPRTVIEIRLATDGTITGKRLVKASGVKAWDDTVLRAVDVAGVVPRDTDGRVPPVMELTFRYRE